VIVYGVWRGALAGLALAVLLAGPGRADTRCVTLSESGRQIVYPVAVGDKFILTFAHSIYGSQIEEQFRVGRRGFESVQLRYSELRLVEFYGHESAKQDNGWWVVNNPGREIPALDLHVSHAALMRIALGAHRIALGAPVASDGRARLTAGGCPSIIYD
jgi:hypothetical protein